MPRSRLPLSFLLCTLSLSAATGKAQSTAEQGPTSGPTIPLVRQPPNLTFRVQPAAKQKVGDRALHFPVPVLNLDRELEANSCYTMRSYRFQNDPNRPDAPTLTSYETCQSASQTQLRDTNTR